MTRFKSSQCDCELDLDIETKTNDHGEVFPAGNYDLADYMNLECSCGNRYNLDELMDNSLRLSISA